VGSDLKTNQRSKDNTIPSSSGSTEGSSPTKTARQEKEGVVVGVYVNGRLNVETRDTLSKNAEKWKKWIESLPPELKQQMSDAFDATMADPEQRERSGGIYQDSKGYFGGPTEVGPPAKLDKDGNPIHATAPGAKNTHHRKTIVLPWDEFAANNKRGQWHTHPNNNRPDHGVAGDVRNSRKSGRHSIVLSRGHVVLVNKDGFETLGTIDQMLRN